MVPCVAALVVAGALAVPRHPDVAGVPAVARPTPLVVLDGAGFYAHGGDLLGLDAEGHVVRRARLGARIADLRVVAGGAGSALAVTLVPRADGPTIDRLAPPAFRPESPPFRGFYAGGLGESLVPLREARAVALGWDLDGPTTFDAGRMKSAVLGLRAWEGVDTTNPYAPALRGEILRRLGDEPGALSAFARAADLPGASPFDLLRVSTLLEDQGAVEPAARAFARGRGAARFAEMESQVAAQVLLGVPRVALARALGTGDVVEVDRLCRRLADVFPRLEAGDRAWSELAAWMDAHGRPDLGAAWRARAAEAGRGLPARLARLPAAIDRRAPLLGGFSLVLPLAAFAVGLRRGARATTPRRRVADLVGLALLAGTLVVTGVDLAGRLQALARAASVPTTLVDGASAAPDAERWAVEHLVVGPEQSFVLAELRAGRRPGDEPLAAAIVRPDLRRALGLVLAGDPSLPTGGGLRVPWSLGVAAVAFSLGVALGRRTAGARGTPRWYLVARATPGGPTGLGPLGPVVAGLGLAGLLALAGLSPRLSDVEAAEPTRYFGLETLARPAPPPDLRWAWVTLGTWALLHLLAVRIDKKRLSVGLAILSAGVLAPRPAVASEGESPGRFVLSAHTDVLAGASLGSGFEQCPCESRKRPFGGTVGGRAGYDFDFGFVFEIDAAYQYGVSTSVVRAGIADEVRTSGLVVSVAGGVRLPVQRLELHALLGIGAWMGIVSATRAGQEEQVETTAPLLAPTVRLTLPLAGPVRAGAELGAWLGVADDAEIRGQRAMGWFLLGHGAVFVGVAL